MAYPISVFYGQPDLAFYLPIAAISLLIAGFNPTRIETAHRHLLIGRVTLLDLIGQAIGIVAMIVLAVLWQSVLALVVGGVIQVLAILLLMHFGLPGARNRFMFETAAVKELVSFGKWIFLSTVCWFFASQGDKAILGKFLSLDVLGVYNIGYFLASFPLLLGLSVTSRVMIPVYREKAEPARLKKLRYGLSSGVCVLLVVMAFLGPWIVELLYDARYAQSGAIVVLLCVVLLPQVIGMTYDQAALAAGDSRRFFWVTALRAVSQVALLLAGAVYAGLIGALVGMGLSMIISHLGMVWLARVHGVWDAKHDALFAVFGLAGSVLAIWLHWDALEAMRIATA